MAQQRDSGQSVKKRPRKRRLVALVGALLLLALIGGLLWFAGSWGLLPEKTYTAADFGVPTIHSDVDFDQNGVDDYTDLCLGARADAKKHPKYDGKYWENGYPPDEIGVCTDVVWRAFRQAGYSLRAMVDADVRARPEAYPKIEKPDPNIDFRRVVNLKVFFEGNATTVTLDPKDLAAWQPGDIVIFEDRHIAIVSDKRNKEGIAYIIHNGGQPKREEDALCRMQISGHYRFDASKVPENLRIPWGEEGGL